MEENGKKYLIVRYFLFFFVKKFFWIVCYFNELFNIILGVLNIWGLIERCVLIGKLIFLFDKNVLEWLINCKVLLLWYIELVRLR